MNLLSRYLFFSLLKPFLFCLVAFSSLLIVADLFGSLDDFVRNKAPLGLIFNYYAVFIPGLMTLVLPTTLLFATLYTLLQLSRHSELIAMQAGGVPLTRIYLPFLLLGVVCTAVLYLIMLGAGGGAKSQREAVMARIRGQVNQEQIKLGQVFQDRNSGRVWFMQSLNLSQFKATGVEILQTDGVGRDQRKFYAEEARWREEQWTLFNVQILSYNAAGDVIDQQFRPSLPCPDWTEKPLDMVLLQGKADELSLGQLQDSLLRLHWQKEDALAPFRTQILHLFTYPLSALILLLYGLADGHGHTRRNAAAGVFNAIFVLIAFFLVLNTFLAMGRGARISPAVATLLPLVLFAGIGLFRLVPRLGLHWPSR
jgi:lipopolysaccharide export system permease protein